MVFVKVEYLPDNLIFHITKINMGIKNIGKPTNAKYIPVAVIAKVKNPTSFFLLHSRGFSCAAKLLAIFGVIVFGRVIQGLNGSNSLLSEIFSRRSVLQKPQKRFYGTQDRLLFRKAPRKFYCTTGKNSY